MITLRELKASDVPFMLEWMRDPEIQKGFIKDMSSITYDQALQFCVDSAIPSELYNGCSLNFAIANDSDEYLGTISLKRIDLKNQNAEYAISTRQKAHNKPVAIQATSIILQKAFYELKLHRVYLFVLNDNIRAIRFYEKCGFQYEGKMRDHLFKDGHYYNWLIYSMLDSEFISK